MSTLKRLIALLAITGLATPAAFAASGEPWYLNTTHWTALTLVLFMLIVWRLGAFKTIGKALDSRAEEIQRELDHAKNLREEAEGMLKEAERKQQEASDLAASILRQAESDANALMERANKDLEDMVARREAQVDARIARAQDEATQAVKRVAADAATKASAEIIKANADKSAGVDAFKSALQQAKAVL
jgi:F-type H+-transporting ATPase subunit b